VSAASSDADAVLAALGAKPRTVGASFAYERHALGSVQVCTRDRTAYLSMNRPGYAVGIHDLSAADLHSLAAACFAAARILEAQP
jgi:hypothetical protein